ncbi:hypothetical protein LTR33_003961 [Friedmanniomyces endolithicus]|nr:hypothetical protein LTR33_003961 [Friedmanniomyces endolithicus]
MYATWKVRTASAIYREIEKKDYEIAVLYDEYEELCAEDSQDADYVDDSEEGTDDNYEEDGTESEGDVEDWAWFSG